MFYRRCRRCSCMNNMKCNVCNDDNNCDLIEKGCNNSCPNQDYSDDCDCGFDDDVMDVFPENPNLAQSYVPIQYMNDTFKPCAGLNCGTIFPELVSPYSPGDSMKDIAYIRNANVIGEGCNKCQM